MEMFLSVIATFTRIQVWVCMCVGAPETTNRKYTYGSGWPSNLIKPDPLIQSCPILPHCEEKSVHSVLHIPLLWGLELSLGTFGQCSTPELQARFLKVQKYSRFVCMCVCVGVGVYLQDISYTFPSLPVTLNLPNKRLAVLSLQPHPGRRTHINSLKLVFSYPR